MEPADLATVVGGCDPRCAPACCAPAYGYAPAWGYAPAYGYAPAFGHGYAPGWRGYGYGYGRERARGREFAGGRGGGWRR